MNFKNRGGSAQPTQAGSKNNESQRRGAVMSLLDVSVEVNGSSSSIKRWVATGSFPQPIALGPRRRGWLRSEVVDWLAQRAAARG